MQIITDKEKLLEYIEWLPELGRDEVFYGNLMSRNKYDSSGVIKSDKAQLKSFVATNKDFLFRKIRQLETNYDYNGVPIPQESLALYLNVNPRCLRKATFKATKELLNNIERSNFKNPIRCAKSAIQTSKSKTRYLVFDIDSKELSVEDVHILLFEVFEGVHQRFIETRGGYHLLLKMDENTPKNWYSELKEAFGEMIDSTNSTDCMSPVPGCVQGGFTPKLYK